MLLKRRGEISMKKLIVLSTVILLFAGCFETEFKFKTIVKPDGSVIRETKIDGRGADKFAPPSGKGWEVKKFQTRGGASILEDTFYHIQATGRFRRMSDMGSDYQYDTAKQFKEISDEERKNFIKLGIVEPFDENVYSKNFVHLVKHRGIFKSTFDYQEVFQNKAIIQLLLNDIKKEVVREQAVPLLPKPKVVAPQNHASDSTPKPTTPPAVEQPAKEEKAKAKTDESATPVTIEGQLLSSQAVESIAAEKMKKEILSKFKFHSEVSMPGKIVSANAGTIIGNAAAWEFTMADFKSNYSNYTLQVRSEMVEWKTIVLISILALALLLGVGYARPRQSKKRSGGGR